MGGHIHLLIRFRRQFGRFLEKNRPERELHKYIIFFILTIFNCTVPAPRYYIDVRNLRSSKRFFLDLIHFLFYRISQTKIFFGDKLVRSRVVCDVIELYKELLRFCWHFILNIPPCQICNFLEPSQTIKRTKRAVNSSTCLY